MQRTASTAAFDSQDSTGEKPRLALFRTRLLVGACVGIAATLMTARQGLAQTDVVSEWNAIASLVTRMGPAPAIDHLAIHDALDAAPTGARYEFRTFEVCPGCLTAPGGINDRGFIGATHIGVDGSGLQGYVYDSNGDIATAIPGSIGATVPSNDGRTPGFGFGPGGLVPVIGERDGSATVLAGFPGAAITAILQFNRNGASVGWSSPTVNWYSFFRSADGVYTKLEYPGPVGQLTVGTVLLGWNQAGTMIGDRSDPTQTEYAGLIRHPDGSWGGVERTRSDFHDRVCHHRRRNTRRHLQGSLRMARVRVDPRRAADRRRSGSRQHGHQRHQQSR